MPFDPYFGQAIGLNTKYRVLEDSTKAVDIAAVVYAGRAVSLEASGANAGMLLDAGSVGNVRPYGLAKFNKNTYIDETSGAYGAYGSGQGTVVMNGIVSVQANAFVTDAGTEVIVPTFDASFLTAAVGAPVYVNLTAGASFGQLTTTLVSSGAGQNDQTLLGYLNALPADVNSPAEIRVAL